MLFINRFMRLSVAQDYFTSAQIIYFSVCVIY